MEDRIVNWTLIGVVILVIILKIIGVITISWVTLLAPIWVTLAVGTIGAISLTLICLILKLLDKEKE